MKRLEEENEEFRKYREQMHGVEEEDTPRHVPNKLMRGIFALIMVIVYIGVGVLLLMNYFKWDASIGWLRWIIGVVLIIYGVFRAYRQLAGIDNRL